MRNKPGSPLAVAINRILENLTQHEAARKLGRKQPNVSALRNYRLEGFSAERLMHFLNALDHDVEITIRRKPRSKRPAAIFVEGAALAARGVRHHRTERKRSA